MNDIALSVEFGVEVAVLLSAFFIDRLLFVNFRSKSLDEPNVGILTLLVVVFHEAFVLVELAEVLFDGLELVLERAVVSLSGAEIVGLLPELMDDSFFRITFLNSAHF